MCLCLLAALCSCGNESKEEVVDDIKTIQDRGVIRIGMECDYAPFNWMVTNPTDTSAKIQSGGYADGYDVYFSNMVGEALGVDVEVVKLEWSGLTLALDSGTIDLIIAGMSPTEERKVTVDFTDAYYTGEKVIIVRKDSKYASATSIEEFSGAKLTGQLNSLMYDLIDQIDGADKTQAYETTPEMIVAVNNGVVDGFVDDYDVAVSACNVNEDLVVVRFDEGKGFEVDESDTVNAIGCRKGSNLVDYINDLLADVSEEERSELMQKALATQPSA